MSKFSWTCPSFSPAVTSSCSLCRSTLPFTCTRGKSRTLKGSIRKIRIDRCPFGINSQRISPSKFHQTHHITLGPNQFIVMMMILAGWWGPNHCFEASGVRQLTHIWSHFPINPSSMGLPISWRQISTLTSNLLSIHEVQIYSFCMIFQVLNLAMYCTFCCI